jgi:hypothetical protein
MPVRLGIDAVPWLGSRVNAADENKVAPAVAAMMNARMIDFPCRGDIP